MDKCADLLPDYLSFVRGVVDSPDLSLNISRELLQHDRQLKIISANLEKKLRAELERMLRDDREGYEKFWKNFGRQLKVCTLNNYGAQKDKLQDLLLFYSSTEKKLVTLGEYVSRMPESQKYIYFAAGESIEAIDHMPQTEVLKDSSTEILYFTDKTDEFIADMFRTYQERSSARARRRAGDGRCGKEGAGRGRTARARLYPRDARREGRRRQGFHPPEDAPGVPDLRRGTDVRDGEILHSRPARPRSEGQAHPRGEHEPPGLRRARERTGNRPRKKQRNTPKFCISRPV